MNGSHPPVYGPFPSAAREPIEHTPESALSPANRANGFLRQGAQWQAQGATPPEAQLLLVATLLAEEIGGRVSAGDPAGGIKRPETSERTDARDGFAAS